MDYLITKIIFFFIFILEFTKQIDFNRDCGEKVYNSLTYTCTEEDCAKKGINDICYSSPPISVYTFDQYTDDITCINDRIITELSGDGKLLQKPECAKPNEFDYSSVEAQYSSIDSESSNYKSFSPSITKGIFEYTDKEYSYYYYSCLDGKYERACDYAANLCALSLYMINNQFCQIITNLDLELHNHKIL